MQFKTFLLFSVPFFINSIAFSQTKKYVYYFDKAFNITTQSKSLFTATGTNDSGLFQLKCFNNYNMSLVFAAHYIDSTLNIRQGLFQSYYTNGYTENEGNYVMNKEEGVWLRWDTLGNMIDSTVYKNGQKILNGIYTYYPNGIIQSFKVYDLINHKTSSETYFDNKGVIVNESDSANIGDSDIVFIKTEIEASFPGGQSAWLHYIKGRIEKNMDALTKSHQSGTCRIEFIVDKLGNVTHVVALTMKNSILAEVCVDAVLNGPKWIPARQNGRSVKALREQPITFTMIEQ